MFSKDLVCTSSKSMVLPEGYVGMAVEDRADAHFLRMASKAFESTKVTGSAPCFTRFPSSKAFESKI